MGRQPKRAKPASEARAYKSSTFTSTASFFIASRSARTSSIVTVLLCSMMVLA